MAKGSCLCGAVRFELTGPIQNVGHCHCSMCRKTHGTAFSTFAQVARADLEFVSGTEHLRRHQSSEQVERSFCGTCGARVGFAWKGLPDALWVAVGLFDDDPGLRPEHHIFVGSKASWDEITDGLPQHDSYPPGIASS